jgi:predicted RNA binding protein YcfA (HicA-like mRNA interferase family)
MKHRDFVRHLEAHGCEVLREGGRHTIYINPANGQKAAVPRHKEIKSTTAREICKALGIPLP